MNEILSIKQTYQTAVSPIDNIPDLAKALNRWYLAYPEHNYLHPCVIDGRAALICQRDLSLIATQAYAELQAIAEQYLIYLKQESRSEDVNHAFENRRKNIALVLTFCLGLMVSSRMAMAAEPSNSAGVGSVAAHLTMPINPMQAKIELDQNGAPMISLRHRQLPNVEQALASYALQKASLKVDVQAEASIRDFLAAAYQPEPGDPANISADISEIAQYYAQYPEVIQLLGDLQQKKLVLKYKANNWQAQAWGTQLAIDSVTIFFDTRVGAQLLYLDNCQANPACNISPADALLHELLHAKLMLLDSQHFIAEGNMQETLYPFEHEREVIASENQLYQQMNQHDGMSRPLRNRHTGELYHVNCAACLPTEVLAAN